MDKVKLHKQLVLRLNATGTVEQVSQPFKLYEGGWGYVGLKCLIPKPPSDDTGHICTVFSKTLSQEGTTTVGESYNIPYDSDVNVGGVTYMVFNSLFPSDFTAKVGELRLVINYCRAETSALQPAVGEMATRVDTALIISSILVSGEIALTVHPGGYNEKGVVMNDPDATAAKLNDYVKIVDKLVKPPDNTDADNVGVPSVEITDEGNLKFSNLKGKTGDTGLTPNITANAVGLEAGLSPTVEKSGTIDNPVLTFGLPKGDKGNTGDPFTVSKIYTSIAAMNEGFALDNVPLGGFVVIDTGNVEDEENGQLYIKSENQYTFIVDLSGMQGIEGVGISEIVLDSQLADGSNKYKVVLTNNEFSYFTAPIGPIGNTGQAATVIVGNTTTLPAGSQATITERGTLQDRILDFGIPKGADGVGAGNTTIFDIDNSTILETLNIAKKFDDINNAVELVYKCNGINDNEILSQMSQDFLNGSLTDYASKKIVVVGDVGESGAWKYGDWTQSANPLSEWLLGVKDYTGKRKLYFDFSNATFKDLVFERHEATIEASRYVSRLNCHSIYLEGVNSKFEATITFGIGSDYDSRGSGYVAGNSGSACNINNCTITVTVNSAGRGSGQSSGNSGSACNINNCTLTGIGNSAYGSSSQSSGNSGSGCIINNCTLTGIGNSSSYGNFGNSCNINNCTIAATVNSAGYGYAAGNSGNACNINNCTITVTVINAGKNNSSSYGNFGNSCNINNCTIAATVNSAGYGYATGNSGSRCIINSCTLTGTAIGYDDVGKNNGHGSGNSGNACNINNCTLTGIGNSHGYGSFSVTSLINCNLRALTPTGSKAFCIKSDSLYSTIHICISGCTCLLGTKSGYNTSSSNVTGIDITTSTSIYVYCKGNFIHSGFTNKIIAPAASSKCIVGDNITELSIVEAVV